MEARDSSRRAGLHLLHWELNGAYQPFRSEIATNLGFRQAMLDQIATEPVRLRWLHPWSTRLPPHQPKALSAVTLDSLPRYADPASGFAQGTIFCGVRCKFVQKQTQRRRLVAG